MAFEGLMGKMRKGLAVAALGLASFLPTPEADAQMVNLSINVYDSNNVLVTDNQLKAGNTYLFNADLTALENNVDVSSISSTLNLTFNGVSPSTTTFSYPLTLDGTPLSNDLFSGAVAIGNMTEQTSFGPYQIDSNQASISFERGVNFSGPFPLLNVGDTRNVVSFYFTPNSSSGSIDFNYLTGLTETQVIGGTARDFDGLEIQFMNGAEGGISYSFAVVPEPSTYAAWAGAAVLAGAAWNRRRQKNKAVRAKAA